MQCNSIYITMTIICNKYICYFIFTRAYHLHELVHTSNFTNRISGVTFIPALTFIYSYYFTLVESHYYTFVNGVICFATLLAVE